VPAGAGAGVGASGQEVVLAGSDAVDTVTATIGPAAFTQLLFILLDSALTYTPIGGRVTLALCQEGTETPVTVSDTGSGIDPAGRPRIVERFYRGDAAREVGGSGLGSRSSNGSPGNMRDNVRRRAGWGGGAPSP